MGSPLHFSGALLSGPENPYKKNNLLDIFVAFIYSVVQMDNIILKDNNENRI